MSHSGIWDPERKINLRMTQEYFYIPFDIYERTMKMEDLINTVDQSVKERLLVAGLREIEEHGFNDFSLRRVASSCNLSCAAPYRHFKSKEDLLIEIFKYINSRWQMLSKEINKAYSDNTGGRIIELSVAYLRFLIVTPSYLSMMFQRNQLISEKELRALQKPDDFLPELIALYGKEKKWQNEKICKALYTVKSTLYGTALIIRTCEKGAESGIIDDFRRNLVDLFN